jgi:hypothetical protein
MVAIESSNGGAVPETDASTPAETGAVSGQIQITIEAIRKIARDNMAQMRDNASERSSDFVGLNLPPSAFSEVPVAQAVGRQHQAAQEVFARTIEGVIADLETFAANLEASCAAHEAADEQSAIDAQRAGQGALTNVSASMGDYQYRSDENFDTAGAERRDELGEAPPAEQRAGAAGAAGTPGESPADAGRPEVPGDAAGSDSDTGSAHPAGGEAGYDGGTGSAHPTGGEAGYDGDTPDGAR